MRKSWGAAVAAAVLITGGGLANAMDYRIGINARSDGSWSPFAYRYVDPTDEQVAEAHVLEVNGNPTSMDWYGNKLGDEQVQNSAFAGDYESGFALWSGGLKVRRFEPLFQATSNNGAFAFGARFTIKNKDYEDFEGNGWSAWFDYKCFEMKVGTTGALGYASYVNTGGNFYTATQALYGWELGDITGAPAYVPGNIDNYNYFGYMTSYASLGVEGCSDKNTGLGFKWTQKLRGTDTLDVRLVNMFNFNQKAKGYYAYEDYNTLYPAGWNVQVNYRMPAVTFSTTYKMRAGDDVSRAADDIFEVPKSINLSWHIAASTTIIPQTTLSVGYSCIGEAIGDATATIGEEEYDKEWWGHNFGLSVGFRLGDWSFNFDNVTTLMLLSDAVKAKSDLNRYAWRPYLGESVSLTAHHRINGLLNGHITASFTDANMNSYSDGKAEATVSLFPNVDISPARGVNVNIGVSMVLENFSDRARGWWGDYNSDNDPFGAGSEIYYTYPHTFTVSIPISFTLSM